MNVPGESRETDVFKENKTLRIFQQKFYNVHKNILLNYAIMEYLEAKNYV